MKTDGGAITVFQLMMSFLLVAIAASCVVAGQKETVLDSSGEPVKTNVEYYVTTLIEDRRMRISTYGRNIHDAPLCPQIVVLTGSTLFDPVTFEFPSDDIFELSSDVVRVSTEVNIKFARLSYCKGTDYWRVKDSSSPIKPLVLEGSKLSNDSIFTIQKFGGSYKLAFGSADKPTDIGLQWIPEFQDYRLILSNNSAFAVSFVPLHL